MRNQRHANIPMCLAGVLFCLTLISIHLTGGLYAKYTTRSEFEDLARVAKFEVTENQTRFQQELVVDMTPGTYTSSITVDNQSEVAINYVVTVKNTTGNLPLKFQIGGAAVTSGEHISVNSIPVGGKEDISMNIIWDQEGALAYIGMVDMISITVEAVQID